MFHVWNCMTLVYSEFVAHWGLVNSLEYPSMKLTDRLLSFETFPLLINLTHTNKIKGTIWKIIAGSKFHRGHGLHCPWLWP